MLDLIGETPYEDDSRLLDADAGHTASSKYRSKISFIKELLAVIAISVGVVICVVIITTRDTPSIPRNIVTAHLVRATDVHINGSSVYPMEYRARLVGVKLCRSHKIARNEDGVYGLVSHDCDSLYTDGISPALMDGLGGLGLFRANNFFFDISFDTFTNMLSPLQHQIFVNMTLGDPYTHVAIQYEPFIHLRGSIDVSGAPNGSVSTLFTSTDLTTPIIDNGYAMFLGPLSQRVSPFYEVRAFFKRPTHIRSPLYIKHDLYGSVSGGYGSHFAYPSGPTDPWLWASGFPISAYTTSSVATSVTHLWIANATVQSTPHTCPGLTQFMQEKSTDFTVPPKPATLNGTITVSVVMHKSSTGEVVGLSAAVKSESNLFVHQVQVLSFEQSSGQLQFTQLMPHGAVCTRMYNMPTTDPDSDSSPVMLMYDTYYSLSLVQ